MRRLSLIKFLLILSVTIILLGSLFSSITTFRGLFETGYKPQTILRNMDLYAPRLTDKDYEGVKIPEIAQQKGLPNYYVVIDAYFNIFRRNVYIETAIRTFLIFLFVMIFVKYYRNTRKSYYDSTADDVIKLNPLERLSFVTYYKEKIEKQYLSDKASKIGKFLMLDFKNIEYEKNSSFSFFTPSDIKTKYSSTGVLLYLLLFMVIVGFVKVMNELFLYLDVKYFISILEDDYNYYAGGTKMLYLLKNIDLAFTKDEFYMTLIGALIFPFVVYYVSKFEERYLFIKGKIKTNSIVSRLENDVFGLLIMDKHLIKDVEELYNIPNFDFFYSEYIESPNSFEYQKAIERDIKVNGNNGNTWAQIIPSSGKLYLSYRFIKIDLETFKKEKFIFLRYLLFRHETLSEIKKLLDLKKTAIEGNSITREDELRKIDLEIKNISERIRKNS